MSAETEWILELHLTAPRTARQPDEPPWEVIARVRVDSAGNAVIDGDRGQVPTGLRTFDPATGTRFTFRTDPAGWARNLHTRLRSPYLVPVIVHDAHSAEVTVDRQEAAQLAGMSPDHWSTQVARGQAPRPVPGVSPYRWRQAEVIEHARQRPTGTGNPDQRSFEFGPDQ